jgi:O-antigen/teichoic acid export membrane protein
MSLARQIFGNTAVQVAGRAVGTVLALLTVGIMTRSLGPAGYGQFTTAISFLQFFGILVDFGLTMTMAKMLGEIGSGDRGQETEDSGEIVGNRQGDASRIASNIVTLRLVSGLVFFGLAPLVALAFPYPGAVRNAIAVGTVSFLAMSLSSVLSGVFQRHLATKYVAVAEVAGRAVLLLATWFVIHAGFGLAALMLALAAGNVVQLGLSLLFARRFVRLTLSFDFDLWRAIIRESWPIAASIAFNLVYLKGDVIIMSVFRPLAEVGLYGAAYKVLDVVTVVPTVFMGLVLPVLAADWAARRLDDVRHKVRLAFDALALLGVPLFLGTVAVARDLMILVASDAFADSGRYLTLLMLAAVAVFLGSTYTYTAVALGLQKRVFWLYGLDAALSIALYFVLIPRWGGVAAAWVTVFSEVFIAVACAVVVIRALRAGPSLAAFGKALVAGLLMLGILTTVPGLHVLLRILLGAVIYGGLLMAFGAVKKETVASFLKPSVPLQTPEA